MPFLWSLSYNMFTFLKENRLGKQHTMKMEMASSEMQVSWWQIVVPCLSSSSKPGLPVPKLGNPSTRGKLPSLLVPEDGSGCGGSAVYLNGGAVRWRPCSSLGLDGLGIASRGRACGLDVTCSARHIGRWTISTATLSQADFAMPPGQQAFMARLRTLHL